MREEKRRLWEEGRDCAIKLQQAGVPFTFGSANSGAAELLKKVRTLVEKGLPSDAAIAALTTNAAKWLGDEAPRRDQARRGCEPRRDGGSDQEGRPRGCSSTASNN